MNEKENPNWIKKRFYKSNDTCIQRPHAFRKSVSKKNICQTDLDDSQIRDRHKIIRGRNLGVHEDHRQHKDHDNNIAI